MRRMHQKHMKNKRRILLLVFALLSGKKVGDRKTIKGIGSYP